MQTAKWVFLLFFFCHFYVIEHLSNPNPKLFGKKCIKSQNSSHFLKELNKLFLLKGPGFFSHQMLSEISIDLITQAYLLIFSVTMECQVVHKKRRKIKCSEVRGA